MADNDEDLASQDVATEPEAEQAEEQPKLQLEVKIDKKGACERHITAAVSHDDVKRYFEKEYSELMPSAQVPGFRPGHAPRRLVEHRFRKDVAERVKANLLMDSLGQIHEEQKLSAISEPTLELGSIEVPEDGPLVFEFDLEVRPEFDLPKWKGLTIKKPVRDFTKEDVDRALQKLLTNRGRLVPYDGPAEPGDYLTTNLTIRYADQVMASAAE
jgi:trigger factor